MPSALVVDDEDLVRQLMRKTFEHAGYDVVEATNGKAALDQFRLTPTDLVIIDILMPDHDGFESISAIRRVTPATKIIAITGSTDMIGILNFLDVAKMIGAHRTLQKPFEMKDLLEAAQILLQA
jgi:two-component system, chemotaxis family, chemotaxis protein CheY